MLDTPVAVGACLLAIEFSVLERMGLDAGEDLCLVVVAFRRDTAHLIAKMMMHNQININQSIAGYFNSISSFDFVPAGYSYLNSRSHLSSGVRLSWVFLSCLCRLLHLSCFSLSGSHISLHIYRYIP